MAGYEGLGVFYLGRNKKDNQYLLYDSKDLVTHAVCVGMTGSGKTGLCIGLLEEAAIDGIPALIIDPKGDLSNLLLNFPTLSQQEFEPWVNADDARTQGLETSAFAAQQAELWKNGLGKWDQDASRIQKLRDAADFTIYTPGSDAGVPVSIVQSFAAPPKEVLDDREMLRDRIAATATSLLGIAGIDADPVQSREHALLSNILDNAWRNGQDLSLEALIAQVQKPPFSKVGVMDLNAFYPEKDRFGLAMSLNNLLASPGFEAWLQGEPLDIGKLLYTPQAKPRMAIFSIAHLSDAERMFFVSLLLNQTLGWVRSQSGTTSLRALLYMDEIFGYFPPVANPPSKKPLLTLLKQARAYGLGVVLATQNPVDLDYKGLANTGTWFIGRLQTERDKARVMEGLEGAAAQTGAAFDRNKMDQILAGLGKRVFLMNNVHEPEPVLFETRWTLSYLRGPLGRPEIRKLMDAKKSGVASAGAGPARKAGGTAPVLPPDVQQYFVPARSENPEYTPMIAGSAKIQFTDNKAGVDVTRDVLLLAPVSDGVICADWDNSSEAEFTIDELEKHAADGATFADLPAGAATAKSFAKFKTEFAAYLFRMQKVDLFKSPSLGAISKPGESERDFRLRLQQTAREERDALAETLRRKYAPKLATLEERKRKAEQAQEREAQQASSQKMESMISIGTAVLGGVLGAFMGRKAISATTMSKVGSSVKSINKIRKESSDVERAGETVEAINAQIDDLNKQFEADVAAAASRMDPATEALEPVTVRAKKTGITVNFVGLVWTAE
ncbi:ATP-binding protein [Bryobacterales bacterium F-183]|nr:ATP-binding protein [Bryobacterales bacterium F-183]